MLHALGPCLELVTNAVSHSRVEFPDKLRFKQWQLESRQPDGQECQAPACVVGPIQAVPRPESALRRPFPLDSLPCHPGPETTPKPAGHELLS